MAKQTDWKNNLNETLQKIVKDFGFTDSNCNIREITKDRIYYAIIDNNAGSNDNIDLLYKDLSFVLIPIIKDEKMLACVVSLGLGTAGFENDRTLAGRPGTRRLFKKLRDFNKDKTWLKTNFVDISNCLEELTNKVKDIDKDDTSPANKFFEKYNSAGSGYILAASLIVFEEDNSNDIPLIENESEGKSKKTKTNYNITNEPANWKNNSKIINAWIAAYAKVRKRGGGAESKINNALEFTSTKLVSIEKEIEELLETRKYVVLQGAPGTGKTFSALEIAKKDEYKDNVYFTQFHAETTYSDFVWGIKPVLAKKKEEPESSGVPLFKEQPGTLLDAIEKAQYLKDKNQKVLLIIDEINRANLSNVLGPVFYLFEPVASDRNVSIKIGEKNYEKLPDNLHVIATMNTADRSLAVVDFALRRRFAWYTLRPHILQTCDLDEINKKREEEGKSRLKFNEEYFNKFADIFEEFATDEELNLQPGHSYFIVDENDPKDKKMIDRMRYELMPLIKEYLAEGFMLEAKDRFYNLFLKYDIEMYE